MSNCCCCWALCLVHLEATAATPGGRVAKLASARSVLGSGMGNREWGIEEDVLSLVLRCSASFRVLQKHRAQHAK